MAQILLVDDEERMLDLLDLYLSPHGYSCFKAASGLEAVRLIEKEQGINLVLLDIMMPEMDGWKTAEMIREVRNIPIIMLTARDQKSDVVKGLQLGADDYITKPFDEEELLARIQAVLRRTQQTEEIEFNGLVWNGEKHELLYEGKSIRLTPKEFALVGILVKSPDRVFSREQLIEWVWGFDSDTEGRTVDSHVRNLREKVRKAGFPIDDYLQTVWGVGYKMTHSAASKQ
ncbi:response regulator transcription factor [Bacillus marinisedimentorum]|uniref:response regulator transcription factor n=1 Tax=Bacillus marinisedimentorum TaxID=1821260 RepID=UPI0007E026C4|nr:response regulator transcription factor [Bacillus marinisedimentorum]